MTSRPTSGKPLMALMECLHNSSRRGAPLVPDSFRAHATFANAGAEGHESLLRPIRTSR